MNKHVIPLACLVVAFFMTKVVGVPNITRGTNNGPDAGVWLFDQDRDGGTWVDYGSSYAADPSLPPSSLHQAVADSDVGDIVEIRGGMAFDFNRSANANWQAGEIGLVIDTPGITIRGNADDPRAAIYYHDNYAYSGFHVNAPNVTLQDFDFVADGTSSDPFDGAVHQHFVTIAEDAAGLTIEGLNITGARGIINTLGPIEDLTFSNNTVDTAYFAFGAAESTWSEDHDLNPPPWIDQVTIDGEHSGERGIYRGAKFTGDTVIEGNTFTDVGKWSGPVHFGDGVTKEISWSFPVIDIDRNDGTLLIDSNLFSRYDNEYAVFSDVVGPLGPRLAVTNNTFGSGLGGMGAPLDLFPLDAGGHAVGLVRLGDIDGDGFVSTTDITAYLVALTIGGNVNDPNNLSDFELLVPTGDCSAADLNGDLFVNNLDTTRFVELLNLQGVLEQAAGNRTRTRGDRSAFLHRLDVGTTLDGSQ